MARCCGGSGTCACKVESGRHVEVTGMGTSQDPFVIRGLTSLSTTDNDQFVLALYGDGTLDSPWMLSVQYADTASLDGVPGVDAPAPTNGQVLAWSEDTGTWTPQAPVTAAPGLVSTELGVVGDGSVGNPIGAYVNGSRYLMVDQNGLGLSNSGINHLIRWFDDATARANANPPVDPRTLSILDTTPGVLEYFDGTNWLPVGARRDIVGQLLSRSGAYTGGATTQYVRQVSKTTDGTGAFVLLSADDLTGYSGVIAARITPTGPGAAWVPMVSVGNGIITCVARRQTDGTPLAGATVTGVIEATLY